MTEDLTTCGVCGAAAEADERCDDCRRPLYADHLIYEAQWWDVAGWDGIDVRCPAHRRVRWDTRDLHRGRYLPLPDEARVEP